MKVTDQMLMALADGELERDIALDVRRAVEADPVLGARLAEFELTRKLAKRAFEDVLDEPTPLRLVAALGKEPRHPKRAVRTWLPVGAAVAASAAAFVLGMVLTSTMDRQPGSLPDARELASLLQSVPSGETRSLGQAHFEATGSFEVPDGVCRGFQLSGGASSAWQGVACKHGESWDVEMLVADRPAADQSYSPASDRASESVAAFLDALGAGAPLEPEAERQLLQDDWRTEAQGQGE
jgi:hypothetical protein